MALAYGERVGYAILLGLHSSVRQMWFIDWLHFYSIEVILQSALFFFFFSLLFPLPPKLQIKTVKFDFIIFVSISQFDQ